MLLSEIDTRVSFYTGANASNYTTANRLISLNTAVYDIETEILRSQDGWDFDDANKTDFPILTTSLVANQADYALPSGATNVCELQITYDGTNWVRANRMDEEADGNPTDTTSIADNYSTDKPFYDLVGNSLFVKPIPSSNVSGGLKIKIGRLASAFTSAEYSGGTKSPGFDVQFHDMVPIKMSMDWCLANDMARLGNLNGMWQSYLERLKNFYGNRDKDTSYSFSSSDKNYN